jgi:hypothetical protein
MLGKLFQDRSWFFDRNAPGFVRHFWPPPPPGYWNQDFGGEFLQSLEPQWVIGKVLITSWLGLISLFCRTCPSRLPSTALFPFPCRHPYCDVGGWRGELPDCRSAKSFFPLLG